MNAPLATAATPAPDAQRVRSALVTAGWRPTRQRQAVYEYLRQAAESHHHPTAEQVYKAVKSRLPSISLATVYKALEALVASGLVNKLSCDHGPARFDARCDGHYHLRCLRTGRVEDLPTPYDPDLLAKLDPVLAGQLHEQGFHLTGYRLELVGYFDELARRGRSEVSGEAAEASAPPVVTPLVDTHAHLADRGLLADLPGVLERARAAGLVQIVAIATDAADSATVISLAQEHAGLFAAVGIHPNEAAQATDDDWPRVVELARSPGVVAIGETGLDRYRDRTPFAFQQQYFDRHLDLAGELGLPVVIHCRQCERDIIEQLARRGGPVSGVLHSFTGTWDDAQAFLELGLYVSFAGQITFQNKALDALREVAAQVPADRCLVETDSPYLSPHPHRGGRNEPARVAYTAERLALVRHLQPVGLARLTTTNAQRLFRLANVQTI